MTRDVRSVIDDLIGTLEELKGALGASTASVKKGATGGRKAGARTAGRRVRKPSAALVLQGKYMGALRALGARDRAKVKALRAQKGTEDAIVLARKLRRF